MGTFEYRGCRAREGSEAGRGGEGLVEFGGSGAELGGGIESGGVDGRSFVRRCRCGGWFGVCLSCARRCGLIDGGCDTTGRT